ncbi:MAG: hypothetical protein JRJ86_19230 [Deltaproteobacteria bacterium]|nr:hypothetical protein [Deltaproteobacteria bacterium]MBW2345345.1 hypothetical protein [Deltaproteobacteria bacterium]
MGYWGYYPPYVSVSEKRAKAAKKLKQLKKKNPDIKPVLLEGTAIAKTWWGKSWNRNLESYADYSNRIGRGRSYVRHGAVLDLQINSGKVESLVQGTRSKPYSVSIKIKGVNKKIWQEIKAACEGKLESLQELLAGKFPKALGEIFTTQGKGLFPSPKEIDFSCSCPDWAYMCKHVAATLYGIGARLDDEPGLFFKLRKVKMKDLVAQAVEDKTRKLLKKAKKKTTRVISESDVADVFGIDMEETVAKSKKKAKVRKRTSKKKKSLTSVTKKVKGKAATKKKAKKAVPKKAKPKKKAKSPFDTVIGIVRRSRKGVNVARIREKTGFDDKQIRTYIYKAKRQGKIKNKSRGVYLSSNKKLA